MEGKKISLMQSIGITMAFFGTVRSIPILAVLGWAQISYLILAVIFFALPISLIAAELATTYPKEGGPQIWVKEAFGNRFSFATSWLLWVQMFFGMVMTASITGVMIGCALGNAKLSQNNIFVFICILVSYWLVTFLNFKFDMVAIIGDWGGIIGVYIPFAILIILGLAYLIKYGINPHSYLAGGITVKKVLPNLHSLGTLTYFAGVIFVFSGIEISSVHAHNMENPKKNYPITIIFTLIAIVSLNLISGLTMSNAVPAGQMELSNIMQPVQIYCQGLGIPAIFPRIIAAIIAIGVLVQLSAWILGPSKAMAKVAEEGLLPKVFQKRNKKGIPVAFVLVQATAISVISLVFLVLPNVNSAFIMMTITTTILYCLAYILMIASVLKLRKSEPNIHRPFKIGGNKTIIFVAILAYVGIGLTILASLIPPSILEPSEYVGYIIFQVAIATIIFLIPFVIYKFRKPSWKE